MSKRSRIHSANKRAYRIAKSAKKQAALRIQWENIQGVMLLSIQATMAAVQLQAIASARPRSEFAEGGVVVAQNTNAVVPLKAGVTIQDGGVLSPNWAVNHLGVTEVNFSVSVVDKRKQVEKRIAGMQA